MIAAGLDVGSTTTKVALLRAGELIGSTIVPAGELPVETARQAWLGTLENAGVSESDVEVLATTGYGRRLVNFGDMVVTEIKACAQGITFACEQADRIHTIIDVGGQDTKVIALNDSGLIEDFSMNDKCAAGTGRFLEMLAGKLGLTYEACAEAAGESTKAIHMNATCAVFAESEVVGLLARGESKADIAAAAHFAIASRVRSMVKRVGQRGEYVFVGGGARNGALVAAVEECLGEPVHVPNHAQLVIAIGAAICASNRVAGLAEASNDPPVL